MKMIETLPQVPLLAPLDGLLTNDSNSAQRIGCFWLRERDLRALAPWAVAVMQACVPQYMVRSQAWLDSCVYVIALSGHFNQIPEGDKVPYYEWLIDTDTDPLSVSARLISDYQAAAAQLQEALWPTPVDILNAGRSLVNGQS